MEALRAEPWIPRARDTPVLIGRAAAEVPHEASIIAYRVTRAPSPENLPEQERRALARSRQRFLQLMEQAFAAAQELGSDPWDAEHFQVAGTTGLARNLTIVGGDYRVPASPESTLAWLELTEDRSYAPDARREALAEAEAWQAAQREVEGRIHRRLVELARSGRHAVEASAYLVKGRRLVTFSALGNDRLEALVAHLSDVERASRERVYQILR